MKKVMVAAFACVALCNVSEAKDLHNVKAPAKVKVQVVVVERQHLPMHRFAQCSCMKRDYRHDVRRRDCKCKFDRKRKEVHHHVCKR